MRTDFLASVGIVDEQGPQATIPRLAALNGALAGALRYFEIVYVVSEAHRAAVEASAAEISRLPNLRIILTSEGTGFYRQRSIAASEMIGDVVALLDLDDLDGTDLATRLSEAKDSNEIMLGWRPVRAANGLSYRLLSPLSRNLVSAQAARTILLPRERLNAIFARNNASLDLRFEPRSAPSAYRRFAIGRPAVATGAPSRRVELLMEILLSGAPRYLKGYAAFGFLVALGAMVYALYAVAILIFRSHVQEGWFSNAIFQSGSTMAIAGGMSIMALALTAVLENMNGGDGRMIVDEIANISFFDKVTDRNVTLGEAAEPNG